VIRGERRRKGKRKRRRKNQGTAPGALRCAPTDPSCPCNPPKRGEKGEERKREGGGGKRGRDWFKLTDFQSTSAGAGGKKKDRKKRKKKNRGQFLILLPKSEKGKKKKRGAARPEIVANLSSGFGAFQEKEGEEERGRKKGQAAHHSPLLSSLRFPLAPLLIAMEGGKGRKEGKEKGKGGRKEKRWPVPSGASPFALPD